MLHPALLERMCRARDVLREAGERRVTVKTVAKEVGLSQFHFIRLYRSVFGETPHRAEQRARLERAKELLTLSPLDVTNISLEVGFNSLGTFSRLFSREFGMAPTVWRKKWRANVMPIELAPGCLTLMGWLPS